MSIEDRLRNLRWTGSLADLPDMLQRVDRRARRGRIVRAAASVSVALLLIAGGVSLAVITRSTTPGSFVGSGGSDWTTYHDPQRGWSMRYPAAWHLQPVDIVKRVDVEGALVSNIDHTFTHPKIPHNGFTTAWDFRGLPPDVVAIYFQHLIGGVQVPHGLNPDTKFPLSLSRAIVPMQGTDVYGLPISEYLTVTVHGDSGYAVYAWFGPSASQADKAIAERIVESITFPAE